MVIFKLPLVENLNGLASWIEKYPDLPIQDVELTVRLLRAAADAIRKAEEEANKRKVGTYAIAPGVRD